MQQMFPCHKCGWQNVIGQRFCGNCAEVFEYNCPYCNVIVDPEHSSCPSCGSPLVWGYQQTATEEGSPSDYDDQYDQQPYETAQMDFIEEPVDPPPHPKKQKVLDENKLRQKKKNQLIVVIAFVGLVLCIGGAIYLGFQTIKAVNPDPPVSATDNHTSQHSPCGVFFQHL